ncbi:hypothetical protein GALL_485920 [mine drainage metagenome]|uniref:Uncharacterized protein n=1 Tax=mine drainage metagenome TaxID=410659 RepID=A0A1J5PWW5_9ZZZZ
MEWVGQWSMGCYKPFVNDTTYGQACPTGQIKQSSMVMDAYGTYVKVIACSGSAAQSFVTGGYAVPNPSATSSTIGSAATPIAARSTANTGAVSNSLQVQQVYGNTQSPGLRLTLSDQTTCTVSVLPASIAANQSADEVDGNCVPPGGAVYGVSGSMSDAGNLHLSGRSPVTSTPITIKGVVPASTQPLAGSPAAFYQMEAKHGWLPNSKPIPVSGVVTTLYSGAFQTNWEGIAAPLRFQDGTYCSVMVGPDVSGSRFLQTNGCSTPYAGQPALLLQGSWSDSTGQFTLKGVLQNGRPFVGTGVLSAPSP